MTGRQLGPTRKETAIPTPTTIVAHPTPPTLPPPPNPANSPLGHYLLHPGQETSGFVHHVLHALAIFGRDALPFAIAIVALVAVASVALALSRRQGSTANGQLVAVAPGLEVDQVGAEVFWNALHGVLRRNWRTAVLAGRPHVSFEVSRARGRLRIGIWVPPHLSAQRVASAVEAAWPSAVADVVPASPPLPDCATVAAGAMRLADKEWFPIRAEHPADPHRVLLRNLGDGGSSDAAVVQVLARPASPHRQGRCRSAATALRTGQPTSPLMKFVRFWTTKGVPAAPNLATNPFLAGDIKAIGTKQSALCFEAAVRYAVGSPSAAVGDRRRLRSEAQGIVAGFAIYDGRNRLIRKRLRHPAKTIYCRRFGRGDLMSVRNPTGCREPYVPAGDLEAQVEQLYQRIQLPKSWLARLREDLETEITSRQRRNASEREFLSRKLAKAETERRKLLDAYYAGAIDVSVLKTEQARIGSDIRIAEERLAAVDAHLAEWQEILETAMRFATNCAKAYARASPQTRRRFNQAVFTRIEVRDGKIADVGYHPPFDLLFSSSEFEYGDLVRPSRLAMTRCDVA